MSRANACLSIHIPCNENTLWFNSQQKVSSAASFLLRVSLAGKRSKSKKKAAWIGEKDNHRWECQRGCAGYFDHPFKKSAL
jgi:hypothetical protein